MIILPFPSIYFQVDQNCNLLIFQGSSIYKCTPDNLQALICAVSTKGATQTFSLMIYFLILSYLMRQLIHYNIVIFATSSLLSYWLYNIQHSVSHNNTGLIAVR
jgi:hypothetical protein